MQDWIKHGIPPSFGRDFQINMPSEIDLDAARGKHVRSIKYFEGDMADNNKGHEKYLLYEKNIVDGWQKGKIQNL